MYSSSSRQYILKLSTGKVYNFYYDDKLGLCYSTLTKRNTWTEPVSLQKTLHQNFHVDIDSDDIFHILTQDTKGSIFYSRLDNDAIKTAPVLGSKVPSAYNKYLSLVPLKNNTNVFYVIEHNESLILAHQVITGGAAGNPRVVDYVFRSDVPYSAVSDRAGNIYAFYQSSDGRYLQLGYRKYIPLQKYWSEFTPITRFRGNSEFPRTIIDDRNIIHLCYQRRGDRQYELIYQQKVPDRNLWSGEVVIHSSAYPFAEASIMSINDILTVFWVREDIIYFSSSADGGSTWSKPARQNFTVGRQLVCIAYRSNDPYENEKVIISETPGCFVNGYKLAFYQDAPGMVGSLSPNELRNMIVDTLKLLKGSVEELRDSQQGLREDFSSLRMSQEELRKEVSKYTIRLDMLEKEIKQFRTAQSLPVNRDSSFSPGTQIRSAYPTEKNTPNTGTEQDNIITNIQEGNYIQEAFLSDENVRKGYEEFKQHLTRRTYKLSRKYANSRFRFGKG